MNFMATVDDLLFEALRLPSAERARLAHELLLSLDGKQEEPAETAAEWAEDIRRRAREVISGKVTLSTLEEVQRDVAERIERVRRER